MSPEIRMFPSGRIVGADTLAIADDPRCITLVATLELAVPLWIWELRVYTDKQRAARGNRCAGIVAEQGDILQFGSKQKGKVAGAFNALAEGLACAAYVPGGVTFAGRHWCVDHQACLDAEAAAKDAELPEPVVPAQRAVENARFNTAAREAL